MDGSSTIHRFKSNPCVDMNLAPSIPLARPSPLYHPIPITTSPLSPFLSHPIGAKITHRSLRTPRPAIVEIAQEPAVAPNSAHRGAPGSWYALSRLVSVRGCGLETKGSAAGVGLVRLDSTWLDNRDRR